MIPRPLRPFIGLSRHLQVAVVLHVATPVADLRKPGTCSCRPDAGY
ncbi:hypothetical protein KCP69_06600 [Salmonella enterica subsp. enterica]|nr:hypothetical protein KCP69_06600 [Salmonella enterica subsp. enterica]